MGARQMTTESICPGAAEVTDVSIRKQMGDLVPPAAAAEKFPRLTDTWRI